VDRCRGQAEPRFFHGVVAQVQSVYVSGPALDQVRIDACVKGDLQGIRGPGKAAHAKLLPLGVLLAGLRGLEGFGDVDRPKMLEIIFLAHDLKVAQMLFAILRYVLL
jgi:hypothetical protein